MRAMYGCKGSSGLKPCLCCLNVCNGSSGLTVCTCCINVAKLARQVVGCDASGRGVYHYCTDPAEFIRITPAVLDGIVRRLRTASAAALPELEIRLGWKLQEHGVMFKASARRRMCPSSELCYDWAPIFVVNGIWNLTAGMVFHKLRKEGISMALVCDYVGIFTWSKNKSDKADPKRLVF